MPSSMWSDIWQYVLYALLLIMLVTPLIRFFFGMRRQLSGKPRVWQKIYETAA